MAQVGEKRVVLLAQRTPAAAATTTIGSITGIVGFTSVILILNVTAQSGTTPTLDVYVQQELPIAASGDLLGAVPTGTSTWDDLVHFTQVGAATGTWVASIVGGGNQVAALKDASLTAASARSGPIGTNWRIKEVVGGTTPSYTYSLTAVLIP